jgi:hypothetical protein
MQTTESYLMAMRTTALEHGSEARAAMDAVRKQSTPWVALATALATMALAALAPATAQATTSDDGGVHRFMQTNHAMMHDGRNARGMAEGRANIRAWQELRREERTGSIVGR